LCVIVAGIATALDIYFDFSGYCDMADGISQMLGFTLPQNFNSPFKAASVQELWQRWHMTLSRFLTKYVYIPLGGSRRGVVRTVFNILLIFFISGLWHGAGWNYVVWGLLNGILVIFDHFHRKKILPKKIRQVLTFLFFSFSVIIFQAPDLVTGGVMVKKLAFFTFPGFLYRTAANLSLSETYVLEEAMQLFAPNALNIYFLVLMIIILAFSLFLMTRPNAREIANNSTFKTRQIVALAVIAVLSILSLSNVQTFIYFTF
jgi:alginate O-acetyltransferase complex protein AlgI